MSDTPDSPKKRSGQVRHDAGGRAIWEWAMESGRHAIDSTSRLLKRLDLSGLTLVDDEVKHWEKGSPDAGAGKQAMPPHAQRQQPKTSPPVEIARDTDPAVPQGQGRSFNPYDTRTPARRAATRPPAPPRPRVTQPVRPARKPGLFARLFGRGNT